MDVASRGRPRRGIAERLGKLPGSVHFIIREAGGIARARASGRRTSSPSQIRGDRAGVGAGREFPADRAMVGGAVDHLAKSSATAVATSTLRCGPPRGRRAAAEALPPGDPSAAPAAVTPSCARSGPRARLVGGPSHGAADPGAACVARDDYQSFYIQSRNVLRKELTQELRRRRVVRAARTATRKRQGRAASGAIPISQWPPEVADRACRHWEGDLIAGRTTATSPRWSSAPLASPSLRVPSAETMTVIPALIRQIRRLPAHLTRSLTWDRGTELAHHRVFSVATGVQVYFCDPQSPWQRGSNENTNGLLRQYFPKGVDLSTFTQRQLDAVADRLNGRPRETLDWRAPAEMIQQVLR